MCVYRDSVSAQAYWDPPSQPVAELMRAAAAALLKPPRVVFDVVDTATLAVAGEMLESDPVLAAELRSTNHANLVHWATANLSAPGARVAANLGPETLGIARDIVRRGLDDATLITYRIGQNAAWRYWMGICFAVTSDLDELRELLDVSSRSIFAFVDDTVEGIRAQMDLEREQLTGGTQAERLEVVTLILEGAPITSDRASARLHYELARRHTAAILWIDAATPDRGELDRAAEALARAGGARRPFTVVASSSSIWAWISGEPDLDLGAAQTALADAQIVRVALGSTQAGMEGFRRSHLDALATQRLLHHMPSGPRVASYEDVQLVALAAQDEEQAAEFVTRTLGDLAAAPADLRDTLRAYIRHQFSPSRTAAALFMHRNTILNRLDRARELLPIGLAEHGLQIGVALEIAHWLGIPTSAPDAKATRDGRAGSQR